MILNYMLGRKEIMLEKIRLDNDGVIEFEVQKDKIKDWKILSKL
jgi:hypothetical protein